MIEIREYRETEITPDVALGIAELACKSFPDTDLTPQQRADEMVQAAGSVQADKVSGRRFVAWDGDRAVAHSRTFVREIFVNDTRLPVLALATVCSDPELRGRGYGVAVTLKAFEQIGKSDWPELSLFQTPVAPFYEKLNCRVVTNRFVNKKADDPEADPWRDDTQMIYPAQFDWPDGLVDLNGPDY